ncbi:MULTISPECIES: cation:proton antiporter [Pseudomonas]|jgi:NhaP-type Na+/H+ and K+/H+ antiporters|uniref:Putative cation transport related protein, membrane protein n=1 Tax=Pseudomonas brassicacearum (strain NFM421) TaxID=994484 RepID=F2KHC8_PSEBN|nr:MULTISPECIES: cation:proton antiporter [Pseudomonas]EIK65144.1 transporter, CPA2 family [Pseudomonas fluorescens Q8r1-96]KIR17941.1 K(+)/H(+) antiporter NhaP [Pseudomonas fluorescens]AEA69134.1 putative cation transport related protein, membrane protein [Pseudomonas brassicacearum subsp. brassicacearum NFM421]ALQ03675.1 sodium/hydrogen exchanger family protein [Pseudomonas brassicacearum]AOS37566.1 sodium:proton antiporter [Pseudomonas brassicacearum]
MTFTVWVAVLGAVLLTLALTSSYLRWMPVTTSAMCLVLGVAIGPMGLDVLKLDISDSSVWMEHLTEVAVVFSLFVSGLKLRLPLNNRAWRVAFGLAGPVMILCIAGLCLALHYLFGLSWGVSMLIGAMLAPTDPVLAALVQVNDARDDDRVRFGLSGEAGLNDGTAFPFVIFGLLMLRDDGSGFLGEWLLRNVLWAVPAGLLVGYWMGRGIGKLTLSMRIKNADSTLSPNDYLALALIALAYVVAEWIQGYGFLSVFAAGLGLRQAEVKSTDEAAPPAEHLVQPVVGHETVDPQQAVLGDTESLDDGQLAAGVMMSDMLAFGSLVERSMEVFLVTLLGVVLANHWDWRALAIGALLFAVIRPLSVLAMPWGRLLDGPQRLLIGWFGIRGIGSLFYLFFALNHDLQPEVAQLCINLTLSVVALSILVHGVTTQPTLAWYERRKHSG